MAVATTDFVTFTSVFCTISAPKRVTVSAQLSDDARAVEFRAVAANNDTYVASYSAEELSKANTAAGVTATGAQMLGMLSDAFNKGTLTSQGPAAACEIAIPVGSALLKLNLPKAGDGNGTMDLIGSLFDYYRLRTVAGAPQAEVTKAQERKAELEKQVNALTGEVTQLKQDIERSKTDEKAHAAKHDQLSSELSKLVEEQPADAMFMEEPDLNGCLARNGLAAACRGVDVSLLEHMKGSLPKEASPEKGFASGIFSAECPLPQASREYVMKLLQDVDKWDYNIFAMQDNTEFGALFYTGYALLLRHNLIAKLNLDETRVFNFLSQVEAGYHSNPYHNSVHAGDVAHVMNYILTAGGLIENAQLSSEDTLAAVLAGLIHDYDHPGINNGYQTKTQCYLALLYNDRSILENHHCAEVFELCKTPQYNIFSALSDEQRRVVRETMIEMVLSTDMGMHAKIFGIWKKRVSNEAPMYKHRDDQLLALSMGLKMADISNCGRPPHLYKRWTVKLFEEFYLQGDAERNRSWPVSPFMDRETPNIPSSQVAFMNFVVIPMFESVSEFLPNMQFTVDHCEENKAYWAKFDAD